MMPRFFLSLLFVVVLTTAACRSETQTRVGMVTATPSPQIIPTILVEPTATNGNAKIFSLVDAYEPGERLTLTVRLVDSVTGIVVPQAELYVRQTDDAGYYEEDAAGFPRIHGRLHSDDAGMIRFGTILPGRYPNDPTASRHIHLTVTAVGYEPLERVLLFDNDPYLTDEERGFAFAVVAPMKETAVGSMTEIELALLPTVGE